MTDLNIRIADALKGPLPSSKIAAILEEAIAADSAARESYTQAEAVALDPLTEPDQVAAARKAMDDAKFTKERLANGVAALNKRLDDALKREQEEKRNAEFVAAAERQKAASACLRNRYPELAQEIADILAECAAADRQAATAGIRGTASVMAGWPGMRNPLTAIKLPMPTGSIWPRKGCGN